MTNVPGLIPIVPGTRNAENQRRNSVVPGVPGVPGICARVRDARYARPCSRAHLINVLPRAHTRNTRNTRNKQDSTRLSMVPGTRNAKNEPGTRIMTKPLRIAMPTVAAFIDEMRDAFGDDCINPSIKAGMDGQQTFWARENGYEVGTRAPEPRKPLQRAACATCAHWSSIGAPVGYCGSGRADLEPAYGQGHPLRRLPQNKGADCAHYQEQ